jgi:hypothetical protein
MSKLVFNRDGGKSDEYGTLLWHQRAFSGEVAEGCIVEANSSPDMDVRVTAGTLRVPTGSSPSNFWYEAAIDTADPGEAVTIAAADPSNPRKDYVVAYIDTAVTPDYTTYTNNSNDMLVVDSVAGTPAGSPSYPNTAAIQAAIGASNPYIILAGIAVGTGVTQITTSDITDLRSVAYPITSNNAVLLDYVETTDLHNPTAVTANTWTDIKGNQNFTIAGGTASVIEATINAAMSVGATNAAIVTFRFVIDSAGTPVYKYIDGGDVIAGKYTGVGLSSTIKFTGLAAGVHTIKSQIYTSANENLLLRASSVANQEFLQTQVTEFQK